MKIGDPEHRESSRDAPRWRSIWRPIQRLGIPHESRRLRRLEGEWRAETQRRGDMTKNSAPLRLCGRLNLMRQETPLGGSPWHRPVWESAWGGNRARRRGDAEIGARTLRLGGWRGSHRSREAGAWSGGRGRPQILRPSLVTGLEPARASLTPRLAEASASQSLPFQLDRYGFGMHGATSSGQKRCFTSWGRFGDSTSVGSAPAWRNGRRDRLKICCPEGRGGSSPSAGTTFTNREKSRFFHVRGEATRERVRPGQGISFCQPDSP